jgi:hypothetical protein
MPQGQWSAKRERQYTDTPMQLYADARRAGLAGRSRRTKAQLAQALRR